jgi:fatty-acyl-CoA synthase
MKGREQNNTEVCALARASVPDSWLHTLGLRTHALALCSVKGSPAQALSFSALDHDSARLSAGFKRLGLRAGEAIAIWLPNSPAWLVAHFAAARAGLTTIPINTWSRASELEHLLKLGQCRAIIIDSGFRDIDFEAILTAVLERTVLNGTDSLSYIIDRAAVSCGQSIGSASRVAFSEIFLSRRSPRPKVVANDAMIAFSTSGTTSLPKLAVHSAEALIDHAHAVARAAEMNPTDIVLCALPPCGAYGYGLIMASLASGAKAILCETFDLDEIVSIIAREHVTMLALTEPLLRRLLDHHSSSQNSLASLRIVFSAGGTLLEVVRRAEEEFGFRVSNVYGSSEVLALASFWGPAADVASRSVAGGVLVHPSMSVRAASTSGVALPAGVSGELQFRGPILMSHYLNNPIATAEALGSDGWFATQDLGVVLDNAGTTFHYIARNNDALRLKGFLVNPGEIEAMLQSHPMVAIAQVVGIPDPDGEDIAVAFVIPVANQKPSEADLKAFCRVSMASYKSPTIIRIIEAFPMTRSANGDKVLKQELREMARIVS